MPDFVKTGSSISVVNSAFEILLELPANKVYQLEWDMRFSISLQEFPNLVVPNPFYNHSQKDLDVMLKMCKISIKNVGILLTGEKGCGKTVDAKFLIENLNLPCILITKKVPKEVDLIQFFNSIEQDFIIFIDEFEKNFEHYSDDESKYYIQKELLSLFDGLNNSFKKIFILTSNSEIDDLFYNRPSRIQFVKEYKGISEDLAQKIVDNKLNNKKYIKDLLDNVDLSTLNLDIFISIIETINKLEIPYSEFKHIFNYKEVSNDVIVEWSKDNLTWTILETDEEGDEWNFKFNKLPHSVRHSAVSENWLSKIIQAKSYAMYKNNDAYIKISRIEKKLNLAF